jgi:ubiquinone/menaquinone biosynthesis C-methylase UbiE
MVWENKQIFKRKKDFYSDDSVVEDYDDLRFSTGYGKFKDRLEKLLIRRSIIGLSRHPTILDCGCGTGRFAAYLAEVYGEEALVVGLDYSESMLERARFYRLKDHMHIGVELIRGDVCTLPFKPRSFDLITCVHVLIHLPNWESLLSAFYDLLKPGGYLFFDVFSGDYERFKSLTKNLLRIQPKTESGQPAHFEDSYLNHVASAHIKEVLVRTGFAGFSIYSYDILFAFFVRNLFGQSNIDRFLENSAVSDFVAQTLARVSKRLPSFLSPQMMVVARK